MLGEDLSDVVEELATGTYQVLRAGAPVDDGFGRVTLGPPTALPPAPMSVQPVGVKLEKVPEGERADDWREVYSTVPLYTASVTAGRPADLLLVDGEEFEVQEASDWTGAAGFCEAMVKRVAR